MLTRMLLVTLIAAVGFLLLIGGVHAATSIRALVFDSPLPNPIEPQAYLPLIYRTCCHYWSTSRYMATTDYYTLWGLGCDEANGTPDDEDIVVVLDFGQPGEENGVYGTYIFAAGYPFRSTTQILNGVKGFLNGFWSCSNDQPNIHITLAIGTSNYGPYVTSAHGAAWANLIDDVNDWIDDPPSYASRETARGANDFETWVGTPYGPSDPLEARDWVSGYISAYDPALASFYYNYGACDGCPWTNHQWSCEGLAGTTWSCEDIWYISYGATPAWPLPLIYETSGVHADQWYHMSVYSIDNHGYPMNFKGSMTQWQACHDPGHSCNPTLENRPEQGWAQLYETLYEDERTRQGNLPWATDVTWEN